MKLFFTHLGVLFALTSGMLSGTKADAQTNSPLPIEKWTGGQGGLIFGYSPLFAPKIAKPERLNSGKFSSFDFGLELKENASLALRIARATVPSLKVYDSGTFLTSYSANANATVYELLVSINAPLHAPYSLLGPVQFFIPLQFGSSYLWITGNTEKYSAMSLEGALGLGLHLYTWSTVRFDLSGLYRFGFPLIEISKSDSTLVTVQNSNGENLKMSLEGFEMRVGITLMLPAPAAPPEPPAAPTPSAPTEERPL